MKIPIWNKLKFQTLKLLSYVIPIRMRGTITTSTEAIKRTELEQAQQKIQESPFPLYRLNADLVFVFDRFTQGPSGIQVVLKTFDEKRTLSVPMPLFELLFVKKER